MKTTITTTAAAFIITAAGCLPALACEIEEVPLATELSYHVCAALDGGETYWTAVHIAVTYGHTSDTAFTVVDQAITDHCPQHFTGGIL